MSKATARAGVKQATVSARIIKADGTVVDLGMIASNKLSDRIKIKIKEVKTWLMQRM